MQYIGLVDGLLFLERMIQMYKCINCGHDSHCGAPLRKDFRRHPYNKGPEGQIEVCKSCSCENCNKSDSD